MAGNKDTIIENARILASIPIESPIIVAGNRSAASACRKILEEADKQVVTCANVMPKFGQLNIEPAKNCIREMFLERIIKAKGLSQASRLNYRDYDADTGSGTFGNGTSCEGK